MRLLLDCSPLRVGGGIQVGLAVIHNALTDQKLKVCIVCSAEIAQQLTDEQMASAQEIHVVGVDLSKVKARQAVEIKAIEQSFLPDVVFTVFGPSYWRSDAVNVQGFALGKMLYPESRQAYPSRLTRLREELSDWLKKLLLRRNVDYFVVETQVVKERLCKLLQLAEDRVFVVGNSYSPAFGQRCQELNGRSPTESRAFSVFVPASSYPHKNLKIVPAVAAELHRRGCTDVRFSFTLDHSSAGWREISHLAESLGVSHMLSTVGTVPNQLIADHYMSADAVLCPTLVESSTAVFPEAFMANRPLLVSDRDFAKQLCGDAAQYFDPHNSVQIAEAILRLKTDSALRARLVEAGRNTLEQNYPSPAEKWDMQLQMLGDVSNRGKPLSQMNTSA